jgi:uncharacterized protein YebE (UPF0316 family)
MYGVTSWVKFSTDQSAMMLANLWGIKAEHTIRTVVQLDNIFNCFAYDWKIKQKKNHPPPHKKKKKRKKINKKKKRKTKRYKVKTN